MLFQVAYAMVVQSVDSFRRAVVRCQVDCDREILSLVVICPDANIGYRTPSYTRWPHVIGY